MWLDAESNESVYLVAKDGSYAREPLVGVSKEWQLKGFMDLLYREGKIGCREKEELRLNGVVVEEYEGVSVCYLREELLGIIGDAIIESKVVGTEGDIKEWLYGTGLRWAVCGKGAVSDGYGYMKVRMSLFDIKTYIIPLWNYVSRVLEGKKFGDKISKEQWIALGKGKREVKSGGVSVRMQIKVARRLSGMYIKEIMLGGVLE